MIFYFKYTQVVFVIFQVVFKSNCKNKKNTKTKLLQPLRKFLNYASKKSPHLKCSYPIPATIIVGTCVFGEFTMSNTISWLACPYLGPAAPTLQHAHRGASGPKLCILLSLDPIS